MTSITLARDAKLKRPKSRAIRPNCGLEALYRQRLRKLVDRMHESFLYWLRACYRANEPELAQIALDAVPASELRKTLRKLGRRWQKQFNEAAPKLADWFAQEVEDRSNAELRNILKRGGYSVRFTMTAAMRDVMRATINEQVSLIKSIPQRYLTNVEGLVMRSVQTGRNLEQLTNDLEKQYGVARRRAATIARSQNNIATSTMTRARQTELGIEEGIWQHSHAGKKPRPTHVAMDGKRFPLRKGMWDKAVKRYVFPGVEPGCRCTSRPVIPGFS